MSYGPRQQCPEGRTAQPGSRPVTAVRALARRGPTTGPELLDFPAPGLSLPRAGSATQAPSPRWRCQGVLHGQAVAQSRRATPRLRRFDRIDLKRDRQPCLLGRPIPWGRSWLTGPGSCGTAAPGSYQGRCGYGPRIPLLVISPWAKVNFVDHSVTDQTSILRFIEDIWDLGWIGDQSFDERAGSLMNMFDFRRPGATKLLLDAVTGEPAQ